MPPEPSASDEIHSYALDVDGNLFEELFTSARLEELGKGRLGAVLVRTDETGGVPLVRTTGRYGIPAQRFRAVHERLARQVQECAALRVGFNNALIESYTNAYTTMGSHSDQATDLAEGSFIAVFSCYQHPAANATRTLVVECKDSGGDRFEVPLTHNGVVAFSVDTNRRLRHKIVLDRSARNTESRWLGVTFRTSKTLVRFREGHAYLPDGVRLTLADEEQRREFYQLRRRENVEREFTYPPLTYTISESDLTPPL